MHRFLIFVLAGLAPGAAAQDFALQPRSDSDLAAFVGRALDAVRPRDAFEGRSACRAADARFFAPVSLTDAQRILAPCLDAVSAAYGVTVTLKAAAQGERPAGQLEPLVLEVPAGIGSLSPVVRDLNHAISLRGGRLLGRPAVVAPTAPTPAPKPRPSRPAQPSASPRQPSRPSQPAQLPTPTKPVGKPRRPNTPALPRSRPLPSQPSTPARQPSQPKQPVRPSAPGKPIGQPSQPNRPSAPAPSPAPPTATKPPQAKPAQQASSPRAPTQPAPIATPMLHQRGVPETGTARQPSRAINVQSVGGRRLPKIDQARPQRRDLAARPATARPPRRHQANRVSKSSSIRKSRQIAL